MSDLNLDFDKEHKKINLDPVNSPTNVNINTDNSNANAMLGVELLVNEKKTGKAELNVTTAVGGGYSSGEDSVKKSVKEDVNFFSDPLPSTPPTDKSKDMGSGSIPIIDDPIIKKHHLKLLTSKSLEQYLNLPVDK